MLQRVLRRGTIGPMAPRKRLYRSRFDRVFAGIFGGIGEYLDVDPVLLRVLWVALTVLTGVVPGILIYIISIFIIPARPDSVIHEGTPAKDES